MAVNLNVFIEKNGKNVFIGSLQGNDKSDTSFSYADEYINSIDAKPISISLPLREGAFSASQTKCFFDSLLPEGYTRRCVASQMRVEADDYISILRNLGKECIGAIQILPVGEKPSDIEYEKMTEQQLKAFAKEGAMESATLVAKSHLSLAGATGKIGLYHADDDWYLPLGSAPSTHIVKQSHVRLGKIVANEQLCTLTAKKLGITVPETFIVKFPNESDESCLLATKRYDRVLNTTSNKNQKNFVVPLRLHQEDFAQALGVFSEEKYEKNPSQYLLRMIKLLERYSANPIIDIMDLWRIEVFNFFIGNTDNHIKNLSLLYSEELDKLRLAPAYDILSTIIYESSSEEMSLSINNKYNIYDITREDFANEAKKDGLIGRAYMEEFDRIGTGIQAALLKARDELLVAGYKEVEAVYQEIINIMNSRKKLLDA